MDHDFVFVHGTGVREPAYTQIFNCIEQQIKSRRSGARLHRCFWGADHGTRLYADGASIPGFATKRTPHALPTDEEYTVGLWALLYQDPFFEVRLLALKDGDIAFVPGQQPGQALDQAVRTFVLSSHLQMLLITTGLNEVFDEARNMLLGEEDYQEMIEHVALPLTEYRIAIANALVAQSVILAQDKNGMSSVILTASQRDALVNGLVEVLGGTERAVGTWVKDKSLGIIKRIATNKIDRRRGICSEEVSGIAGDVLMYQARGQGIRQFIRQTITYLEAPVVVIAHSLGGIAAVDMFLEFPIQQPPVKLLVTVGSQAPFLYELNALVSKPFDPHGRLPEHFPPWLNIYDTHDFLSYQGAKLFPEIHDVRVDNGQPFPESHAAYWGNDHVWDAILSKVP